MSVEPFPGTFLARQTMVLFWGTLFGGTSFGQTVGGPFSSALPRRHCRLGRSCRGRFGGPAGTAGDFAVPGRRGDDRFPAAAMSPRRMVNRTGLGDEIEGGGSGPACRSGWPDRANRPRGAGQARKPNRGGRATTADDRHGRGRATGGARWFGRTGPEGWLLRGAVSNWGQLEILAWPRTAHREPDGPGQGIAAETLWRAAVGQH
jgi:hypothetical protein